MKKILDYYKFQMNEMLLHTLEKSKAEHNIKMVLNHFLSDISYVLYFKHRFMIIDIDCKQELNENKLLGILASIYSTGYYVSQYIFDNITLKSEESFLKKMKNLNGELVKFELLCEAKCDDSIKDIPDKIYHITLHENTENILKNGLIPYSGKKRGYHPERVYVCLNLSDVNSLLKNITIMMNVNKEYYPPKHNKKNETFIYDLLEIDTTNLTSVGFDGKEYDVVFYNDENSAGVYTYDLIKPTHIKLIKEDIDKNN